jgi:DNA-binding NarL/FixJ family response regulator
MKIFIADDSAMLRERLVALISDLEGMEVVGQAGDAPEALEAIQRLKPDVAVLDIRMPGGNGIHVLEAVKRQATPPVVIMLTAIAYPQYRRKCLEAGADFFLDKTTEFERVADVLRQLREQADRAMHN